MVNREEALVHLLENFDDEQMIEVYNEYAEKNRYEKIYSMDLFPELYSGEGRSPLDIKKDLEDVYEGDKYVSEDDVYGWKSFNNYWDSPNCAGETELAKYIVGSYNNLGCSEIQEVLDIETLNEALGWFNPLDRIEIRGLGVKTRDEWFDTLSADELDYLVATCDEEENYIELM